jgi:hypothetical protein
MPNAWQLDWQTHKVHRLLLLVCCRIKAQRLRLIQIQLPVGPEVIRQAGKLPASQPAATLGKRATNPQYLCAKPKEINKEL